VSGAERRVFLNDRPYQDGQEDPRVALSDTLAFSVDDWAATRAMAWVWGIVCGWDDDAMAELAETFRWDETTTARLNRLHAAFDALSGPTR
jgi:hypothetical protein